MICIFSPSCFPPLSICHSFFLNQDSRIQGKCLRKLYHWFWWNTYLIEDFKLENLKKTILTLQILRLKLKILNQTYIWLKSIMQLPRTIFFDSDIFFKEQIAANWLWLKKWKSGRKILKKKWQKNIESTKLYDKSL